MTPSDSPGPQSDPIEELIEFLSPVIVGILQRLDAEEFTTIQFIEVMRSDPAASAAYDEAVRRWGEGERHSKMVIHGQVIPVAMRRSNMVDWIGFAHEEADDYAVPAWWRLRSTVN